MVLGVYIAASRCRETTEWRLSGFGVSGHYRTSEDDGVGEASLVLWRCIPTLSLRKIGSHKGWKGICAGLGTSAEQGNCTGSWKNVGRLHEVALLAELLIRQGRALINPVPRHSDAR